VRDCRRFTSSGVAAIGLGASFYTMSLLSPLPLALAGAFFVSGCVQSLAPRVMPDPIRDEPAPLAAGPANASLISHDLVLPVAGVSADVLEDSFDSPREGGRVHHAIDIPAPRGSAVLAADDGRVLRLSSNTLGGITAYTTDRSGKYVYYYAHLEGYKAGLVSGDIVARGDTIGYVGTTGDAPENLPHLHFQILRMPADGKYWEGEAIDPFPLLYERATRLVGHY